MNSILVTGASGLLGSNFILAAQKRHINLLTIYHHHPLQLPDVESVKADLTEPGAVARIVNAYNPEWIVHCAASTDVDWCEENPQEAERVHLHLSRDLAVEANRVKARMVYLSTDAVFDGDGGGFFEEDEPRPVNVYGRSKLAGEIAVQEELKSSLIVRTNIYGWNAQEKMSLAEWMLGKLESKELLPGFFDVMFTPILVNDLAEIILDMIEQRFSGVYHVTGSQACSKLEFALEIANMFGLDSRQIRPVSIDDSPLRAPRPKNTSLNTQKISRALSRPMPDVESGLRQFKALRDYGLVTRLKNAGGLQSVEGENW